MINHSNFILTPISNILKESVMACNNIGDGIENYTLSEYVFQSSFLKMTGASEQKLKCICWQLASNDFDYRYVFLDNNYGECSNYKDKNKVYKDLIREINKLDKDFDVDDLFRSINVPLSEIERCNDFFIKEQVRKVVENMKTKGQEFTKEDEVKMFKNLKEKALTDNVKVQIQRYYFAKQSVVSISNLVNNSIFKFWDERGYSFFVSNWYDLFKCKFACRTLLDVDLENYYSSIVYEHRNRCAHNLTSYQDNLPTLRTLLPDDYKFKNYFFRFAFLILLDNIFIDLYKYYLISLDNKDL